MDKLIELLQQIQDLAGVAIDALSQAAGSGDKAKEAPKEAPKGDQPPEKAGPPPESGKGGPPPEPPPGQ